MKLSIFYAHLCSASAQRGLPIETVLSEARKLGIEWVEISLDELLQAGESIQTQLHDASLGISCVYASHDWCNAQDTASGRIHVDTALAFGAKSILVIPGQLPVPEAEQLWQCSDSYTQFAAALENNANVQRMLRGVHDTLDYAAGRLMVTMEDYDQRTAVYAGMYGLKYFLDNAPGLGLAFDCGNFAFMNEDVIDAWKLIGRHTVHVHCKDRGEEASVLAQQLKNNRGLSPVATGSGYLPIKSIVSELLHKGYDGIFAIEHFGHPDQLQAMRDSVRFLKSISAL